MVCSRQPAEYVHTKDAGATKILAHRSLIRHELASTVALETDQLVSGVSVAVAGRDGVISFPFSFSPFPSFPLNARSYIVGVVGWMKDRWPFGGEMYFSFLVLVC